MSVKIEKLSSCKVKLNFVVDANVFDEAVEKAVEKKIATLEVPGFRKGHLPRETFNKKFGEASVYEEVINNVVNDQYRDVVIAKKIDVVGAPELDVDFESVGKGKKLKFSITVETWPEVTLGEYKNLEVEKEAVIVNEEDIKEYIDRNLKNHAELEILEEGKLENGHTAVFDFEGFVDGKPFDGGKAESYSLEIGSGQFIPGFEEQMVGMEKGEEKTITVKFPDNYQAENLKGKMADFKIKLHDIKKRVIPTLNDEFVKELDIEGVDTVEKYQNNVKEILLKEKEEASNNKFFDDVLMLAINNSTFEVPESLVEEEVNRNFSQIASQAKMYNVSVSTLLQMYGIESEEKYKETIRPTALMTVKQKAVLAKVAEVEKIKVSEKEYNAEYETIAKEYGKTIDEVKKMYAKEVLTPYLKMQKALEVIKSTAVSK